MTQYFVGAEGTVKPPADMMEAARLSLTPTGFANLMERTGGRAPTPLELCEFADGERLAGLAVASVTTGVLNSTTDCTAEIAGTTLPAPLTSSD